MGVSPEGRTAGCTCAYVLISQATLIAFTAEKTHAVRNMVEAGLHPRLATLISLPFQVVAMEYFCLPFVVMVFSKWLTKPRKQVGFIHATGLK
jgi:hypothetical protein